MDEPKFTPSAGAATEARLGFYSHIFFYVAVNLVLLAVNHLLSPERQWSRWVLLGWGLGVVLHGLKVFLFKR